MKIILSELNRLLFPECYMYTADHFKNEKKYLQDTNAEKYLAGMRNIKFTIKVVKLSRSIPSPEIRAYIQYLYEKQVDLFFDWHKEYDWFELKPILVFFIIFSHVSSFGTIVKIVKNRNTHRMIEKYIVRPDIIHAAN